MASTIGITEPSCCCFCFFVTFVASRHVDQVGNLQFTKRNYEAREKLWHSSSSFKTLSMRQVRALQHQIGAQYSAVE